jgi:hypothetical protein
MATTVTAVVENAPTTFRDESESRVIAGSMSRHVRPPSAVRRTPDGLTVQGQPTRLDGTASVTMEVLANGS